MIKWLDTGAMRTMLVVVTVQFLVACVPNQSLFNSGIAKEWSSVEPISREQLIMEPLYYFNQLDRDLDRTTWLLIPQGRLLHSTKLRQEMTSMCSLLESYLRTLEQLPRGTQLPEYELASIYLEIFHDFGGYLQDEKSMQEIQSKLQFHEMRIRVLELALEDASDRRLNTLVQTLTLKQ